MVAEKTKPSEVVCFAEGILSLAIFVVCREEFRGNDLSTILSNKKRVSSQSGGESDHSTHPAFEAVQVESAVKGAHELPSQGLAALFADTLSPARLSSVTASRPVPLLALP